MADDTGIDKTEKSKYILDAGRLLVRGAIVTDGVHHYMVWTFGDTDVMAMELTRGLAIKYAAPMKRLNKRQCVYVDRASPSLIAEAHEAASNLPAFAVQIAENRDSRGFIEETRYGADPDQKHGHKYYNGEDIVEGTFYVLPKRLGFE